MCSNINGYALIIPSPHHYAYFMQFDWLEKKFYLGWGGGLFLYKALRGCAAGIGVLFTPEII